jgi:hypothetical protein
MNLDLAIHNILSGVSPSHQIDVLTLQEARRRQKKMSILQQLAATGWKGAAVSSAVAAGLSVASWKTYKYLERKSEKTRTKMQKILYKALKQIWSRESGEMIKDYHAQEWARAARAAIKASKIPIAGPLLECLVIILADIIKTKKKPSKDNLEREAKKESKKAADEADSKVASHSDKNIVQHRLEGKYRNDRLSQAKVLQLLWNESKAEGLDLYGIILEQRLNCDVRGQPIKHIDLKGVSPKALGQAFMDYLGEDYSEPGARKEWKIT